MKSNQLFWRHPNIRLFVRRFCSDKVISASDKDIYGDSSSLLFTEDGCLVASLLRAAVYVPVVATLTTCQSFSFVKMACLSSLLNQSRQKFHNNCAQRWLYSWPLTLSTSEVARAGAYWGGKKGHNAPGAESLGGAEKSQQCCKCFLQYGTFDPERPEGWNMGRQTYFLSLAPSNVGMPLGALEQLNRSLMLTIWIKMQIVGREGGEVNRSLLVCSS